MGRSTGPRNSGKTQLHESVAHLCRTKTGRSVILAKSSRKWSLQVTFHSPHCNQNTACIPVANYAWSWCNVGFYEWVLLDNIANFPNHRLKVVVIVSHRQTHAATVDTPSAQPGLSVAGVCSHLTVCSWCVTNTRTSTLTHTSYGFSRHVIGSSRYIMIT